jgi:hypothetical protein
MFLILYIFSLLFAQDVIKYPETPPVNNPELLQRLKQKEHPQLLDENYWDDDRILFSTYFGGSGYDCINDGAFDSQGNFIQVGYTGSPDLPIVGNAFQKEKNLSHDMFIVKWNPEGDVIWSTFLGGSGSDVLYSVAIDKNDDIIVAGRTESFDIIVSDDAPQLENKGGSDFYLAKFTTDGEYVWSTYWGGERAEMQCRMVIDEVGNIYLGGNTTSSSMTTREDAYQKNMDKEYVLNGEWQTKSGVYLAKFTPEGKYNWGTYFSTGTERRDDPMKPKFSLSWTEVLTGIDVYKDEIAFSWDLETYFLRNGEPIPEFVIVTDDAEQKEGVGNAGWQTQIFKIDTAGTTLKYGTFYCGDNSLSRNIKYDKYGNLILHVATLREKPKKDSVFKSSGHLVFVKYNRNNDLEWDFGFGCFDLDKGSICYDFDIDENNVLWTAGRTSCKNIEKGINPFPTDRDTSGGTTGLIFIIDLNNYKHWFSYYDLGGRDNNDVSVSNNILNTSGATETLRTKIDNKLGTFYNQTTIGFFISIDLNDIINYMNPTDSVNPNDTLNPNNEILFYPNPVKDYIYLKNVEKIKSIKIIDLVGKEFINITEIKSNEINVSQLSVGVYFLVINEDKVFKIIKR